jgi:4-hydroxybenzoyl-CoA thioesterase
VEGSHVTSTAAVEDGAVVEVPIRLFHSDPAGIIYYPNYFGMFDEAIEEWLAKAVGIDYAHLVRDQGLGLPIVSAECRFRAPVRIGDRLRIVVTLDGIEHTGIVLVVHGAAAGEPRVEARLRLAMTDLNSRARMPIPAELRRRLGAMVEASPERP